MPPCPDDQPRDVEDAKSSAREAMGASLDVYLDYASPFAYLACEVLPAVAERLSLPMRFIPIDIQLLGNYADGLPYSELKRRYVVVDAVRSAQFHGVAMNVPNPHPVLSNRALCLATSQQDDVRFGDLNRALFRAAWRDQGDVSTDDVLVACIEAANGPVDAWLEAADAKASAERLAAQTAAAEARGVFGVPSMFLKTAAGEEQFWGLDSLPALEWRLGQP